MTFDEPRLGLRERKKLATRRAIVAEAVALLEDVEWEAITVEMLTRRLDISQATFFRYYPTKDAVLREVALDSYRLMNTWLVEELDTDDPVPARLRRFFHRLDVDLVRPGLEMCGVLARTGAMDPIKQPELRDEYRRTFGLLAALVAEGQRRGEIGDDFTPEEQAQFLEGMAIRIIEEWAIHLPEPHDGGLRLQRMVDFHLAAVPPKDRR